MPWTASAHAKDIWTSPDWRSQRQAQGRLRWVVTCTRTGFEHLSALAGGEGHVHLSYHGLDLSRFGHFDGLRSGARRKRQSERPVTIVSVGRAVEKKGFDTLLEALALLPADLAWRFEHIGGGEKLDALKAQAQRLGLSDRIAWRGALAQEEVLATYRRADLFALACRVAADGDRDGLPNVLVEASSQGLACISTTISGVPELIADGAERAARSARRSRRRWPAALERAIREPALRERLGAAAETRVRTHFDHLASVRQLRELFRQSWASEP